MSHTHYFGNFPTFTQRLHSKRMRHVVHGDGVHLNDSIVLTGKKKEKKHLSANGTQHSDRRFPSFHFTRFSGIQAVAAGVSAQYPSPTRSSWGTLRCSEPCQAE